MTIAQDLYDNANTGTDAEEEAFLRLVKKLSIGYKRETLGTVVYTSFSMPDGSTLVIGDNGYIGLGVDGR